MRRLPTDASRESYLAADAEAGLLDLHLLGANELSREVILLLSTVAHPNLARLRDAGVADGEIYLVEDHIDGVALQELANIDRFPGDVTLHLIAAVASALAEAEQMVHDQQQLVARVPRLAEIFVSSVGQIKMGLTAVIGLHSSVETLIDVEEAEAAAAVAVAAGRSVARRTQPAASPLAGLGSMVARLLGPPREDDDPATRAARELGETARQGIGAPGDCRVLHGLAVAALRQTASTPTGGFVSGKLSDLVERFAPRCGIEEAELAAAGALLVAALPDGTPAAGGVRSFYAALDAPAGMRGGQRAHLAPIGAHTLGQNLQGTPYRLVRKLGVGGMGIVFEAEHTDLNRRVAIKVLHGALNRDPQVLARFKQEARSAARIRHPHIVEIYDFGTTSAGEVFLVMELLSGQNLARLCRSGRLPPWRSLDILRQVCEGVEAAHQAGVIHRDLKPDNVMITPLSRPSRPGNQDLVKVLDFGIAKLRDPGSQLGSTGSSGSFDEPRLAITRQGQLFGTPEYMAPEQILGGTTDHRVDIYSLGCIAYEVLTGELPFPGDNYGKMLASHLKDRPVPLTERVPELPPELDDVVLRAMSKEPEDRYASMAEFGEALAVVLEFLPAPEAGVIVVPMTELARSAPIAIGPAPSARYRLPAASAVGSAGSRPSIGSGQPVAVSPTTAPIPRPVHKNAARPFLWGGCGALLGLCGLMVWISRQPKTELPVGGAATVLARDPVRPSEPVRLREPVRTAQVNVSTKVESESGSLDPAETGLTSEPSPPTTTPPPVPQVKKETPAERRPIAPPPTAPTQRERRPDSRPPIPPLALATGNAGSPPSAGANSGHPATTAPSPRPAPAEVRPEDPTSLPPPATAALETPKTGDKVVATPPAATVALNPSPAPSPPLVEHPTEPEHDHRPQPSPMPTPPVKAVTPPPVAAQVRPAFTTGRLSYTVLGTTSAYGRRDANSGLDSTRRALEACYQRAIQGHPGDPPRGASVITFSIDEDGHFVPRSSSVDATAGPLRPCLDTALQQGRFPRPEIGPVTITLRVNLEPLP